MRFRTSKGVTSIVPLSLLASLLTINEEHSCLPWACACILRATRNLDRPVCDEQNVQVSRRRNPPHQRLTEPEGAIGLRGFAVNFTTHTYHGGDNES